MTILTCYDTTGPRPADHEIMQVGGVFCTDDLNEVHCRFGSYVRPQKDPSKAKESYLRFLGIRGVEELKNNTKYWTSHENVWSHFLDLAQQYGQEDLEEDPLKNVRIIVFDASFAREFLEQSLSQIDGYDRRMLRYVGGLLQTTLDYSAFRAYLGQDIDLHEDLRWPDEQEVAWQRILRFYDVEVSNLNDAVERASAMRSCYFKLFQRWKSSTQSKSMSYGRRTSRKSGSNAPPVTRQD